MYVRMLNIFMLGNNPQSVMSVEDLHAQCIYILLLFCYFVTADSVVVHFSP